MSSARISLTKKLTSPESKTPTQRIYKRQRKNTPKLKLFPEPTKWFMVLTVDIWKSILLVVGRTHPESVACFGSCSKGTIAVVMSADEEKKDEKTLAQTLSLKKHFCRVATFSLLVKVRNSFDIWWTKYKNPDAGCMMGAYMGFYTTSPTEGMTILNEIAHDHVYLLAIYIANVLERLRGCSDSPVMNISICVPRTRLMYEEDPIYADELKWMLAASVCASTRGGWDPKLCTKNGVGHYYTDPDHPNLSAPITCTTCVADYETSRFK